MTTEPGSPDPRFLRSSVRAGLALVACLMLVLTIRAIGYEQVFLGGEVIFPPADAQYHLRRAFYSWVNFPSVLLFDPYINYPGGASIPWPPLFDWTLAGFAWLLASDQHGFELVAAWTPPVLAVLTALGIYCAARTAASHEVGLVACVFFSLVPLSVNYTRIGNVDHHAAVAMLGAWLLCLALAITRPGLERSRMRALGFALFALRLALLLTWHGSLLYLVLFEATLLLVALVRGECALPLTQSASALGVVLWLVPFLMFSPTPLLGDYSAIALSWLHVMAVAAVAFVSGSLGLVLWRRPESSLMVRAGVVAGGGLAFLALLLVLPGPREGLLPAMLFLTLGDEAGARTAEQAPLFELFGRTPNRAATSIWGFAVYLIPVAPLAALGLGRVRRPGRENAAAPWILAGWGLFFGVLAIVQKRYGNDYQPVAAVLFAIACVSAGRSLAKRLVPPSLGDGVALAIALVLVGILMAPALTEVYVPRAERTLSSLADEAGARQMAERRVAATLSRFGREIGRVTPPTSSYLAPGDPPEYGILAHANLGHAIQYLARRATATDPFWEYIGQENWARSAAFLREKRETRALELARQLQGRYLISMPDSARGSVVARLHAFDGSARGRTPALHHFRLITEAPASGQSIGEFFARRSTPGVPYKLFEIVRGAVLELDAEPGAVASARLKLKSPQERVFDYETQARATEDGVVRLVLPYATESQTPVQALGVYRIRLGDEQFGQWVTEEAVQEGLTVRRTQRGPELPASGAPGP